MLENINFLSEEKSRWFICISLLYLLIFSAYSNTFFSPPVLDDFHSFIVEPNVYFSSFSLDSLEKIVQTKFGISRFVPMFTFALNHKWGQGSIAVFHITNLVIHFCSVLSILFFLLVIFRFPKINPICNGKKKYSTPLLPFLITGLWALNPVQTNAVTYLVQRMTSLAALFYVLSIAFYLFARLKMVLYGFHYKHLFYYCFSFISAILAFSSKQNSATLPLVIIVAELMFVSSINIKEIFFKKRVLFFLILVAFTSLIVFMKVFPGILQGYDHRHFTLGQRLLTELRVVTSYVFLLLFPLPSFLTLEHDPVLSSTLFSPLTTLLSLLFLLSIVCSGWLVRKKHPLITFGIFWFFINLCIESTFIPLELKFEHRLYLPSVGFYLSLVICGYMLLKKFDSINKIYSQERCALAFVFILFSVFSMLTYSRNMVWQDAVTLYQVCVKKAPMKARNHSNLACAYAGIGEYDKAIDESEKAISLGKKGYEEYWVSASNIISSKANKGDYQKAIERGEKLLQEAPSWAKKNSYWSFLIKMGDIYLHEGKILLAYNRFLQSLSFLSICEDMPYKPLVETKIITCLRKTVEIGGETAKKLNIDVNSPVAIPEKMAGIFFSLNDYGQTLKYCQIVLNEYPDSKKCKMIKQTIENIKLANNKQKDKGTLKSKYVFHAFTSKFNFCMAAAFILEKSDVPANNLIDFLLTKAKESYPDSPDIYILSSWLLYKNCKFDAAIEEIDQAIILDPNFAQPWVNRGLYFLAKGCGEEAVAAFQTALKMYPGYPHKNKLLGMIRAAEKIGSSDSTFSVNQTNRGECREIYKKRS
jgi:tetratricopeptide (TPR) repeat protein